MTDHPTPDVRALPASAIDTRPFVESVAISDLLHLAHESHSRISVRTEVVFLNVGIANINVGNRLLPNMAPGTTSDELCLPQPSGDRLKALLTYPVRCERCILQGVRPAC